MSCDTNGDGKTNILDFIRPKKYLVGFDIPLGSNEIPQTPSLELFSQPAYLENKNTIG